MKYLLLLPVVLLASCDKPRPAADSSDAAAPAAGGDAAAVVTAVEMENVVLSVFVDAIRVVDAAHVTLKDIGISNVQGNGIVISGEKADHNMITGVTIANIGGYPFSIGGGDRLAQAAGESVVSESKFSNFGLIRTGRSHLSGVGNTVRNCEFSHSKGDALSISGNNQTVEYCTFKFLNQEGSDAGAVYCGRNPSETGIRIRYNYFQDIRNGLEKVTGIQGVYVDDRSGFVEVYGNIFNRVGSTVHGAAFKVNGGKHNVFRDNIVVDGRAAYIQIHDSKGGSWGEWYASKQIVDKLSKVGFPDPESPWAKRYPKAFAAASDTEQPGPETNVLENNIVLNGQLVWGIVKGKYADPTPAKKGNYEITEDPGYRDLANDDLYISRETMEEEFPGVAWMDFDKMGVTER